MMLRFMRVWMCAAVLTVGAGEAQNASGPGTSKPVEHVIGTITSIDASAHQINVKEDKTGTEDSILLGETKTLLKVPPGATNLKSATRITAEDLAVGDRVDVRGSKTDAGSNSIAAKSVLLMSARDLEQAHKAEAAAWQHSTKGIVNSVDAAAAKLDITTRTPEGFKTVIVDAPGTVRFTRYSLDSPDTLVPSQLADIKPGDQVRVIGERSADGSTIKAQKIYSGAFRTMGGIVGSVAPDGKSMRIKGAGTSESMEVVFNQETAIRMLPPEVAMRLALRLNPTYRGVGTGTGANAGRPEDQAGAAPLRARSDEAPTAQHRREWGAAPSGASEDLSQQLERLPKISASDLKAGDAVIVSGVAIDNDNSRLVANNVIAGAEPILRAAPPRQGQNQNLDWNLGMEAPAQQ